MYIGRSLSLCISEMIEYKINPKDVFIISSWNFSNKEGFEECITQCRDYWRENYDLGKEIALKLFSEGRIYSPAAEGNPRPDLRDGVGIWTDLEGNTLEFSLPIKDSKVEKIKLR